MPKMRQSADSPYIPDLNKPLTIEDYAAEKPSATSIELSPELQEKRLEKFRELVAKYVAAEERRIIRNRTRKRDAWKPST